nr:hypothetical protein [Tanacetum cinerariifolium]
MRFVSKADDYQVYGALRSEVLTNQKMRDSPAYKIYLAFATSGSGNGDGLQPEVPDEPKGNGDEAKEQGDDEDFLKSDDNRKKADDERNDYENQETNDDEEEFNNEFKMRDSPAYKIYLAFATSATSPKKARKFKKPASPSRKRTLVTVEKEEPVPAKKVVPSKKSSRIQSTGVQL